MKNFVISILMIGLSACCTKKQVKNISDNSFENQDSNKIQINNQSNLIKIEFKEIYNSQNSGFEKPSNFVINNKIEYDNLFDKLPVDKIPFVDFSKENVIVLSLGEKNTGGYDVKIDKIEETSEQILVYAKYIAPGPKDMVTMAFTYPITIYTINSKKPIVFK